MGGFKNTGSRKAGFVEPKELGGGSGFRFKNIVVGGAGGVEIACFFEGYADACEGFVAPSRVGGVLGCDLFPDIDSCAIVCRVFIAERVEVFTFFDECGGLHGRWGI